MEKYEEFLVAKKIVPCLELSAFLLPQKQTNCGRQTYHVYPKYWDTLSAYHTCPKSIWSKMLSIIIQCFKTLSATENKVYDKKTAVNVNMSVVSFLEKKIQNGQNKFGVGPAVLLPTYQLAGPTDR